MFSLSGEDFRVKDSSGNEVVQVSGANVNLGGFVLDKLYFSDASGKKERRAPDPSHTSGVGALALMRRTTASTGRDVPSPTFPPPSPDVLG